MRAVGLDIGSVAVKAVLLEDDTWRARLIAPTGWSPGESGAEALHRLLGESGVTRDNVTRIVATGYGRNAVESDATITEISCHALGARRLFEDARDVRTILDIGGQDSKAIALDRAGNVSNFLMNDKCAAGTGRFLQNMAVMLGCGLEEFSSLPDDLEPHPISSMCTVFAESEVVGLLARGIDRRAIALGILDAIASRAEGMLRRVGLSASGSVAFTGGASRSRNLARLLEKRLGVPLRIDEASQYAGALGAAEMARRQAIKLNK
ncbi:MAG: acyl-CoA dehydratase activase [Synergistaceae bacterium]|nr:acyl-CoA dehydratase activase [Synergistaceae bacterium]